MLASWLQLIFIYCPALFCADNFKICLKIMQELKKGAFVVLDKAYSEFNWQSTGRPQNALNCHIKGKLCLNAANRLNCLFYSNQIFNCVKISQTRLCRWSHSAKGLETLLLYLMVHGVIQDTTFTPFKRPKGCSKTLCG